MPYSAQRWKRREREVARLFEGARIPNNGFGQPDVIADGLAIQVKTRLTLPKWMTDNVDQAIRDAGDLQHALVYCVGGQGKKTRRLIVFDLDHVEGFNDE